MLIHDAQFVAAEIERGRGLRPLDDRPGAGPGRRGRSRRARAVPPRAGRTDEQIEAIAWSVGDGGVPVSVAAEGATIDPAVTRSRVTRSS